MSASLILQLVRPDITDKAIKYEYLFKFFQVWGSNSSQEEKRTV